MATLKIPPEALPEDPAALKALEVAGQVLDLPALLGADLLAFLAAARAGALFGTQLVDLRGHREVFEVGQGTPAPAPLHPP